MSYNMSSWPLAVLLVAVTTLLLLLRWLNPTRRNRVPGPTLRWPILGHLLHLNATNPYPAMEKLRQKYGPIFQLQLGSWTTVVLTDCQQIKQFLNQPEFSYRPSMFLFNAFSCNGHGVASSNGSLWQEQRRFAVRNLRNLGMSNQSISTHVQNEIIAMMDMFNKTVGQPIDLNFNLNIAITNIIWAIVAGRRLEYDNPLFLNLVSSINLNFEVGGSFGVINFLPWLAKIIPASFLGTDKIQHSLQHHHSYLRDIIKEHQDNYNPENEPSDYIDYFLLEQKKNTDASSTFTETQLLVTISDLFVAGGETTSTSLRWAILLITSHDDVQRKIQEEIDLVIGRERLPSSADQSNMPYTSAVIYETLRFSDIISLGLFHATRNDVEFEGLFIPKDSIVVAFLGHSHRSRQYWSKPEEFYPEHFLDDNGQLRNNVEGFLPFSMGKRQCIGDKLAVLEMFMFISHFYQRYRFRLCDEPKPSFEIDPRSGVIRWPSPYKVILEKRQ